MMNLEGVGGRGGGSKLWSAITSPPIALIPSLQETYTFLYSNASVFWLSCELKLYCLFDRWIEIIFLAELLLLFSKC